MSNHAAITTRPRPKIHRLPVPSAPSRHLFGNQRLLIAGGSVALLVLALTSMKSHAPVTGGAPAQLMGSTSQSPLALQPGIGDAQAADRPGKTFLLQGQSGVIVGQLAKIPAQPEQITEMKAVSDIDNGAGRELLSIISKY